jgi:ParB family chromosome partitioning protein
MAKKIDLSNSIGISSKNLLNAARGAALTQDLGTLLNNEDDIVINGDNKILLDVKDIKDNPFQPRIEIKKETLQELANSIENEGQLQPIIVQKHDEKYIVIAGHRRLYAHKLLNKQKIWVSIVNVPYSDSLENNQLLFRQATIENIQRDQLFPLELALACKEAIDKGLYQTRDEISKVINKSKSYLAKVMSILKLSPKIIQDLSKNKSIKDIEVLYELQKIKNTKKQEELYFLLKNKKITREDIRLKVKQQNSKKNADIIQLKKTKQKISLSVNLVRLTDKQKKDFEKKLDSLVSEFN